jgi:hypothetical protein
MATLTCYNSSYYFKDYQIASGDVADAIVAIRTELTSRNVPAWTEPSTALFKSPTDAAGRFFDCLFTKIDQQTLELRVRNQVAATICTSRFQAGVTPWMCRIFSGQFHLLVECWNAGGYAHLFGGILDQSPDPQGSNPCYVYGGGLLSATNTNDGYSNVGRSFMNDGNGSAYADRSTAYNTSNNSASCMYHMNGAKIYRPAETYAYYDGGANMRVAGRKYQYVLCTSDLWYGTKVQVPIDNVSGTFLVTCLPTWYGLRTACRIA